ncbi:sugar kinase [Neolewinella aurantiaca]|uniref:Sugar kinase n=1 Tax=Neolewinella aurantiaca TaxID=2602767 RepID=A0A5C7FUG4_9BACT|nr:sugar kinase [Neolewinella aurantiaca]TXF90227.1 sugar kinase [Neolewinella aurantiaca]
MPHLTTFGEIMLRLSPPDKQRFSQASTFDLVYGGGEANVAASLANYGIGATFVSRLPDNCIGDGALRFLQAKSVNCDHVVRGGERLGIYFIEMGDMQRGPKVVYDRSHSSMVSLVPGQIDWEAAFQGSDWFHWSGVVPALGQAAADECLIACQTAARMGLTISTDINYRAKMWKYGKHPREVLPAMVEYSDIILANDFDAEFCFGLQLPKTDASKDVAADHKAFLAAGKAFMKRFPKLKKVIATQRQSHSASHHSWSALLYDGKQLITAPTYELTHLVDRVGGGDSFVGGLIYGLMTWPDNNDKALHFAVAASALKHSVFGDLNRVRLKEVKQFMKGNASGRISR